MTAAGLAAAFVSGLLGGLAATFVIDLLLGRFGWPPWGGRAGDDEVPLVARFDATKLRR